MQDPIKIPSTKFTYTLIAFLVLINSIFIFLATADLREDLDAFLWGFLILFNVAIVSFGFWRHKRMKQYLLLPSRAAVVKVSGHGSFEYGITSAWQTAIICYSDLEAGASGASSLKVMICSSTVPIPNMQDEFPAQVFLEGSVPKLIVNKELGIVLTVSEVFQD